MVKDHKSNLCREEFTTASEISGHSRHHKSSKYTDEAEASCNLPGEQSLSPFLIAGQRIERRAGGGSVNADSNMQPPSRFLFQTHGEFTEPAPPRPHELGDLYLSHSNSNLNPVSCKAPAEGSVPQDNPVISGPDSLPFQPQDPRPQKSYLDSALPLEVHNGGNLKPVDTFRAAGKRKAIILESPQKYPDLISSPDDLRFSPRQKVRRVHKFEDLFRNDTVMEVQQEEDKADLIYFPSDSIQNSIRNDSLEFQKKRRDHHLQYSSSRGLDQNALRESFEKQDLISLSSQGVSMDLKAIVQDDCKQFKRQQDYNFLDSSYDFQSAADLFLQEAHSPNLEDALALIPLEQHQPQCDDIFPFLSGGLNDIFESGSLIFERDKKQPGNVDRSRSK